MPKLTGTMRTSSKEQPVPFKIDELVIELDHGYRIRITHGKINGIELLAGSEQEESVTAPRFVIRTRNFHAIDVGVERSRD